MGDRRKDNLAMKKSTIDGNR
jgi:hypothetical protein